MTAGGSAEEIKTSIVPERSMAQRARIRPVGYVAAMLVAFVLTADAALLGDGPPDVAGTIQTYDGGLVAHG